MNKPQVGDDAVFYPSDREPGDQGFPAQVAHVWSDTCVNLQVFNEDGAARCYPTSVLVYDEASAAAKPGGYFCVMKPQLKQPVVSLNNAGYRSLSDEDVALINVVRGAGDEIDDLLGVVSERLKGRAGAALHGSDQAEANRWLAMARTDLQVGLMKLVRAITQPVCF